MPPLESAAMEGHWEKPDVQVSLLAGPQKA